MTAQCQDLTAAERFWPRVEKTDTCWLWSGYRKDGGYATFYPGGGRHVPKVYVHRFAYEAVRGPIPDGLEIDHICAVRHCVNPAHLEAVTRRVNLDRRNARKTHCIHGHEYTEANTYRSGLERHCRACRVERMSLVRGV